MEADVGKVNELSREILKAKYQAPGEDSPEDVFRRVARVAAIPDVLDHILAAQPNMEVPKGFKNLFSPYEDICARALARWGFIEVDKPAAGFVDFSIEVTWRTTAKQYFNAMANLDFMPATPTLINAGRPTGMLSSCFFLRIPDSMEGIFERVKEVALISKMGGGVGLDVSDLRPAGASVTNTNGTSSGPISFLKVFNETGNQVQQGGIRRAALIAIMRVDHPDIIEFIQCKETEGTLANFNISVLVTDAFMAAVKVDKNIKLWHPKYNKTNSVKARKIWKLLTEAAWKNGEPGVIFWDELNRGDIFNGKFGKLGVNPCSELPLLEYGSCNLAAINLGQCYNEETQEVNIAKLIDLTTLGITFLDNIIDINNFPLPEIEARTRETRRIGLGTMGLHDLMLKMGIRYGSKESLELINTVFSAISDAATAQSELLGKTRGIPGALKEIKVTKRNTGLLTAQPTGTVAMICNQASSGIEPVFQWSYTRKDKYGIHTLKHFMLDQHGEDLPDYAVTALDLSPDDHITIQAHIQQYIDSSISKTCNLPNSATVADVDRIYKLAHATKCKSVTVYRSGSRQEEVLIANGNNTCEKKEETSICRKRPRVLYGATYRVNTPGGKAYITLNEDPEGIREVFIHISKAGSEIGTHIEAEGRLISNSLKYRIPVEDIIEHLTDHKSNPIFDHGVLIKSVPDAVSKVMREFRDKIEGFSEFLEESDEVPSIYEEPDNPVGEISGEICPECGEILYMAAGCTECRSCGFSHCG